MSYSEIELKYIWAIEDGDVVAIQELNRAHPELRFDNIGGDENCETWLGFAANKENLASLNALLALGNSINSHCGLGGDTCLVIAIDRNNLPFATSLLELGASPNIGRPLIASMSSELSQERQLEFTQLLINHGADVNRLYDVYGDKNNQFSALDFAPNEAVRKLLLDHGAKSSKELLARSTEILPSSSNLKIGSTDFTQLVIDHFSKNFGPVESQSIVEIASDGHPLTIHVIKPSSQRKVLTLFTTGMSSRPMAVPQGVRGSKYAELYIQLPPTWDYKAFKDPNYNWPLVWLRRLAKYPTANDAWLEYPVTIMSQEKPLAVGPNLDFDSFMLFADQETRMDAERELHMYRVIPLYPKERELEAQSGVPALLRAFDQAGVSFVTEPNRRSAVWL